MKAVWPPTSSCAEQVLGRESSGSPGDQSGENWCLPDSISVGLPKTSKRQIAGARENERYIVLLGGDTRVCKETAACIDSAA